MVQRAVHRSTERERCWGTRRIGLVCDDERAVAGVDGGARTNSDVLPAVSVGGHGDGVFHIHINVHRKYGAVRFTGRFDDRYARSHWS